MLSWINLFFEAFHFRNLLVEMVVVWAHDAVDFCQDLAVWPKLVHGLHYLMCRKSLREIPLQCTLI